MSLRMWRKIKAVPSVSGGRSRRLQVWPTASTTSRQQRVFRRNRSTYSGVLRRRLPRRSLVQLAAPLSIPQWLSEGRPAPQQALLHPLSTTATYGPLAPTYRDGRAVSAGAEKVSGPVMLASQETQAFGPIVGSLPQVRSRITNALWMFNNPAAVPGAMKVRRLRQLSRQQRSALRAVSTWLGRRTPSLLQLWAQQSFGPSAHYKLGQSGVGGLWAFVCALESASPMVVLKAGGCAQIGRARQWIQHHNVLLNGFALPKAWSSAVPGDVYVNNKKGAFYGPLCVNFSRKGATVLPFWTYFK